MRFSLRLLQQAAAFPATPSSSAAFAAPKAAYFISRSASNQLPVYSSYRNGTREETILRRIQGDASALKRDLLAAFPHLQAAVKLPKNHVVVKGMHVDELKAWLEAKGF